MNIISDPPKGFDNDPPKGSDNDPPKGSDKWPTKGIEQMTHQRGPMEGTSHIIYFKIYHTIYSHHSES